MLLFMSYTEMILRSRAVEIFDSNILLDIHAIIADAYGRLYKEIF